MITSILLAFCLALGQLPTGNTEVTVHTISFAGLAHSKGKVLVNVFAGDAGWPNESKHAIYSKEVPIVNKQARIVLTLPPGEYAVAAFHDENNNKKLDTNWLGVPVEPYAFSNNVRGRMGPPSYADARIVVTAESPTTQLILR